MKASELFPSTYLNAKSAGRYNGKTLTIYEVKIENIPGRDGQADKPKLAIGFESVDKLMIVNKTNFQILSEAYGDETDDWKQKKVLLSIVRVQFEGKLTPSIMLTPNPEEQANLEGQTTTQASKSGKRR